MASHKATVGYSCLKIMRDMNSLSRRVYGTVIIGGGIAGVGLAYYLAAQGQPDIVVGEANELASGCTRWSLGGVRQQFSSPLEVELAVRGRAFWRSFESDFDYPCPYYQDGYLLVTGRPDVWDNLTKAAQVQCEVGATEVQLLAPDRIADVAPWLASHGLLGGSYTPLDGRFNPSDGLYGIAKAAKRLGVEIVEHASVTAIERDGNGWSVTIDGPIAASQVVIASGLAAPAMARPFGVELDITPLWLHCGYTTDVAVGQPMPLTIDLDSGLIVEREGMGACVTVSDTRFGPGGAMAVMEAFAEIAHVRAPALTEVGIRTTTSAAFDATGGDGHAYIGQIEPGLWVFAGFDGHGTMQGPALAKLLARTMAGDPDPTIDMSVFDPHRRPQATQEWLRAAKQ